MKPLIAMWLFTLSSTLLAADFTCTSGSSKRAILIQYERQYSFVPCQVVYEKEPEGTKETLWKAQNQAGYCEEKAEYLARRLRGFGWLCVTANTQE